MSNEQPTVSARRLGELLGNARQSAGLSRREAASVAGVTPQAIRAYERGSESVPDDVAEKLAAAYGCSLATLLPSRGVDPVSLEPGRLHVGSASAPLGSDDPPSDEVLRSYLGLLYELRDAKPGSELPLRDRDLDALAAALGDDPETIEVRLVELMDVTREEAAAMRATLFRRRLLLPAAGFVLGAGLFAGGAQLLSADGSSHRDASTPVTVPVDGSQQADISTAAQVSAGDPATQGAVDIGDAGAPVVGVDIGQPAQTVRGDTTP
jgi:transcriptional regulator with XRE-family HTH domain